MNSHFDQLTKGLISLTVMLMFTIALIAGQARANLPAAATAAPDSGLATRMSIILDTELLRQIDWLPPHVVDTIFALPIDIEFSIKELRLRSGNAEDAGSDDSSVQ